MPTRSSPSPSTKPRLAARLALVGALSVVSATLALGARGALADPPVARPAAVPPHDAGAPTSAAPSSASTAVTDAAAPATDASASATETTACHEQAAQPELIRSHYIPTGGGAEQERERAHLRAAALRYRTEHYGYFEGFGDRAWNAFPPMHYAERTSFMGLPVRVHQRVVPALHCVEQEIQRSCSATPYHPAQLVGIRPNNSFAGGEVSNHVYGIAVDVDPTRNPCCGCGPSFANHPNCRRHARSDLERMAMPECWIHAFERYGFYWLGHDHGLRDLMHFEFLGDPDRITTAR
jgi:hypothetical protein